jgi:hypothetical protein
MRDDRAADPQVDERSIVDDGAMVVVDERVVEAR